MKKVTAKEMAEMLDGREYLDEITEEQEEIAENSNLLIVFGQSDDLMEFRGIFSDEIDAYEGGIAYLHQDGELLKNQCEDDDCPYFHAKKLECPAIELIWHDSIPKWSVVTELPYEKFNIYENGELFCVGIVIQV